MNKNIKIVAIALCLIYNVNTFSTFGSMQKTESTLLFDPFISYSPETNSLTVIIKSEEGRKRVEQEVLQENPQFTGDIVIYDEKNKTYKLTPNAEKILKEKYTKIWQTQEIERLEFENRFKEIQKGTISIKTKGELN